MSRVRRNRLDSVLKVRRVQEQQAAGRLAAAEAASRQARETLVARQADIAAPWPDRALVELAWAAADRAGAVADARHAEAGEKRADWSVAARRVKALERLDARRRAAADAEERRRQAATLDDIVNGRSAREAG